MDTSSLVTSLEWGGCITGILGALCLAIRSPHSGYGFVLYLVSNAFWATYGVLTSANGLLTQQAVFSITSLIGVWNWLIAPRLPRARP